MLLKSMGEIMSLNCGHQLLSILQLNMILAERWNDTDRVKTEKLGEKPVPVPLYPQQIPYGLTRVRTRSSAIRGRQIA
jgi:hypothetical protein